MPGMKLVACLLAAQLGLSGFLFVRVAAVEREIISAAGGLQALIEQPNRTAAFHDPGPLPREADPFPGESRLRQIIREQIDESLARAANSPPGTAEPDTQYASAITAPLPDFAYERELEAIEQDLNYYTQVSRITKAEMAQLQADIAKLRPTDRTVLLGRVVRALNEGTLDGPL